MFLDVSLAGNMYVCACAKTDNAAAVGQAFARVGLIVANLEVCKLCSSNWP